MVSTSKGLLRNARAPVASSCCTLTTLGNAVIKMIGGTHTWSIQPALAREMASVALLMTPWRSKPKGRVIVHSDQDSQYGGVDWKRFRTVVCSDLTTNWVGLAYLTSMRSSSCTPTRNLSMALRYPWTMVEVPARRIGFVYRHSSLQNDQGVNLRA